MTKAVACAAEIHVSADKAREHVVLDVHHNGRVLGVQLDGADAERLVLIIGKHRAKLAEPVVKSLDFNARLEPTMHPSWAIKDADQRGRRMLLLRHPGLGWLTFGLSSRAAALISAALVYEEG